MRVIDKMFMPGTVFTVQAVDAIIDDKGNEEFFAHCVDYSNCAFTMHITSKQYFEFRDAIDRHNNPPPLPTLRIDDFRTPANVNHSDAPQ